MKTLILTYLALTSVNAFAYDKLLECDAVGTLRGRQLYSIHADVYDVRVDSQGTSVISSTRKGQDQIKLSIDSPDRFTNRFTLTLTVIRGGKLIESSILPDQSLSSNMDTYSMEKVNYPVKNYHMSTVCKRVKAQ